MSGRVLFAPGAVALGLLILVAGCAGEDPAADPAEALLRPADGLAGPAVDVTVGSAAAAGDPVGHSHAHITVADGHGGLLEFDHAHLTDVAGNHHHAQGVTAAGSAPVAGNPTAPASDAVTEAQQQILSGLGAAEPPATETAAGETAAQPAERSGELHVHEDGSSHTHGAGAPVSWTVRYTADGVFVPQRLDITTGDEVVFVNESAVGVWPASNIHPTHEILPEFDPLGAVAPGESWAFTFRRNGYWRYHNHIDAAQAGLIVSAGGPEEALAPLNLETLRADFLPVPAGAGGEALLDDAEALERFVLTHGPAAAVAELKAVELATGRDCHAASHDVGHVAYENFGAAAFTLTAHDCHSGVLHGIIESLIAQRGTSRLAEDVAVICGTGANAFAVHQCYHGVGHGLLAWTTYELPEALLLCDLMPAYANRDACYGGVHMENGVGGLSGLMGHTTEYLDPARPHFPCDILPEHHVPGCYFWQTSNLFWFGAEAAVVADFCYEAPDYAWESCWWSMGRDLGSLHRGDPVTAAAHCGLARSVEHLADCFSGAALSRFTEAANAPFSAELCAIADAEHPPEVAEACWAMVLRDAPHILLEPNERRAFCEGISNPPRRENCATTLAI